ncbi:MAG: XdhC family protein [Alphaproteobacteria bacterium]|nr:XdhC family protein [Alphaproteobacteria bacterium]
MPKDQIDPLDLIAQLRAAKTPFVLATVVRTVAATSAKAGAKAVVTADGEVHGWIGGGCTVGAVKRMAREALADGKARLISVRPNDALEAEGLQVGESRGGVEYQRSVCPSGGTVDVFLEPMLPLPTLLVCGGSPVARAVLDLAPRIGFAIALAALADDLAGFPEVPEKIAGFELSETTDADRYIVVATQGKRDFEALKAALATDASYIGFVGSRRKLAALRRRLIEAGVDAARADVVRSPAGLNIGAITPEEIALSILSEIVQMRRSALRAAGADASDAA